MALDNKKMYKEEIIYPLNLVRGKEKVKASMAWMALSLYSVVAAKIERVWSEAEIKTWRELKNEKRSREYLMGRYACKRAAGQFLGEKNLRAIEIASGTIPHPIVRHFSSKIPELTLTHTEDWAIAIAYESGHIMGVDLEKVSPSREMGFSRKMTNFEKEAFEKISFRDKMSVANLLWTVKESLAKAIKCGHVVPGKILEVKNISEKKGIYLSTFTNFPQFKCLSYLLSGSILSITLPRKTEMDFDHSILSTGVLSS